MDVLRLDVGWEAVTDRVMGGVSVAHAVQEVVDGAWAMHLTGSVSLDQDGGFAQLAAGLGGLDLSSWDGLRLRVRGDGGRWFVSLRTPELAKPWQSYRAELVSSLEWETRELPFEAFRPHRHDLPLDLRAVTRVGVVAVGEARPVDLAIADLSLIRGG